MKVKLISQKNLSSECWPVQVWGLSYCKPCDLHNSSDCGGKNIRKTKRNSLGYEIPLTR